MLPMSTTNSSKPAAKSILANARITCQKGGSHGTSPDTFFANVWARDASCAMLGHGEGSTRADAINAAKRDATARAAR